MRYRPAAIVFGDDEVQIQFVSDEPPREFDGGPVLMPRQMIVIPLDHPTLREALDELSNDVVDLIETVADPWERLPVWRVEPEEEGGIGLDGPDVPL